MLWHDDFDFRPEFGTAGNYSSFIGINIETLSTSFKHNVVNADSRAELLKQNELIFDDLSLKLTISIETSHCEVLYCISSLKRIYNNLLCRTFWCLAMKFVDLFPPLHELLCTLYGVRYVTNSYLPM